VPLAKVLVAKENIMSFYSDKKHVQSFRHRGFMVDIHLRLKGATHCDLDHRPDQTKCDKCGADIAATEVFNIMVNGGELTGLDVSTEKMAVEIAQMFIDHVLDHHTDPDDDEDDDTEDIEDDGAEDDEDENPGGDGDDDSADGDEDDEDEDEDEDDEDEITEEDLIDEDPETADDSDSPPRLSPPPDSADKGADLPPPANRPAGKSAPNMANIIQQMEKLKWFDKAAAIVRGRAGGKKPKKH
jgi:hypothetical protein